MTTLKTFLIILSYVGTAVLGLVFLSRANVSVKKKAVVEAKQDIVEVKAPTAEKKGKLQRLLSAKYSSSAGYAAIKKQIGNIPGVGASGPGCSA